MAETRSTPIDNAIRQLKDLQEIVDLISQLRDRWAPKATLQVDLEHTLPPSVTISSLKQIGDATTLDEQDAFWAKVGRNLAARKVLQEKCMSWILLIGGVRVYAERLPGDQQRS